MVNTNIQGVVPINGRGFTAKIKRHFQPGEYKLLSNARLRNGIIQTRYNINHYLGEGQVAAPIQNAYPFAGFIEDSVIIASLTEQWGYKKNLKTALWAPTNLPTDGNQNSYHQIVGAFEYNNVWYWLTHRYNLTTGTHTINMYSVPENAAGVGAITFASLTATTLISTTETGFLFDNFFIYKERLWITTNKGLYFSKSTDPKVFAVPDGGFFKLRDQNINFAFPHKDTIFILCDTSLHSLSFGSDPNQDAYVREVSNIMGADHGTSHQDQAYVVNSDGVYAISSNNIELVRSDFEIGVTTAWSKLVSWENYLIVIKYTAHSYNEGTILRFRNIGRVRSPTIWELEALTDSNVWFIDMTTGACHTLDFNDQFTGTGVQINERGHVTDMIVNPAKDINRSNGITLMTNKYNGTSGSPGSAQVYLMDNNEDSFFINDKVVNDPTDNIVRRMKPNMKIEIHGYTPDGNEYMMKKFRSLQIMGNFSFWDFEVLLAYDNEDYDDSKAILLTADLPGIEAAGDKRSPFPARIGLNQRARSVSILLRTKNPRVPMEDTGDNIYERVEITDMRFLWTYLGRGPTHLTQSATT